MDQKKTHKNLKDMNLKLDVSRIFDPDENDSEEEKDDHHSILKGQGVAKKLFGNESFRKKVFLGDIDRNSILYDLVMTPMTPRSIGIKLQLYKGSDLSKKRQIEYY